MQHRSLRIYLFPVSFQLWNFRVFFNYLMNFIGICCNNYSFIFYIIKLDLHSFFWLIWLINLTQDSDWFPCLFCFLYISFCPIVYYSLISVYLMWFVFIFLVSWVISLGYLRLFWHLFLFIFSFFSFMWTLLTINSPRITLARLMFWQVVIPFSLLSINF